jgi:D-arabinose 1-dehydrogenase-like Zn-dependent alcohol dehydrogenase
MAQWLVSQLTKEGWCSRGCEIADNCVVKGCLGFSRESTVEFVKFIEEHGIKPVIAKTFEFDQAVEALEALKGQDEVGKIVINIAQE